MRWCLWFGSFFFSFFFLIGVLPANSQDSNQGKSLGDIARELRAQKSTAPVTAPATAPQSAQPASAQSVSAQPATAPATVAPATDAKALIGDGKVVVKPPEVDEFSSAVAFQMYRGDFAQLDKMADEARSTKARFPGGGWKLFTFYTQMAMVPTDSTDVDWQKHLDFFKRWMAANPQSITARVGLAEAYLNYAWLARGHGYADQVTPEGARLFDERIEQAANVLMEASKLKAKCPHWYYIFQMVGLAGGMDKYQLRQIFDKGVAFDPDYYYMYQEQAHSLLPEWGGEEGDTQRFAEETYRQVGGEKGAMLYFLIASILCNECGDFRPESYSWPVLQAGFAALEKNYGLNPLRINDFARMAVIYEDKPVAAWAFARIGDNWEQSAWGSRAQFDAHRAWAGLAPIAEVKAKPAFVLDSAGTKQLNALLTAANQAASEKRWDEAVRNLNKVIEMAKPYPGTEYWLQTAYYGLANVELQQGHMEQARSAFDAEINFVSQRSGANSPDVATALDSRAMFEMKINDEKGEEADFLKAIAIREKAKAPAIQYSSELYSVAMLYRKQGKYKETVEFLQARIPAKEDPDPKKENWWAWPLQALGLSYQDLGQYDQAEKAFDRMIRSLDQTLPVNSLGFVDPLSKMASLYRAMGKDSEAVKVEQRLKLIQDAQGK